MSCKCNLLNSNCPNCGDHCCSPKTFVISDIHGQHNELLKCIELSNINKEEDVLICLGDVCDRGPDVKKCIDELMTFKNLIYIMGNHDWWFYSFLQRPDLQICFSDRSWLNQGGEETLKSFGLTSSNLNPIDQKYIEFFEKAKYFHIDGENRVFVHGGFALNFPIEKQSNEMLMWDRELIDEFNYLSEEEVNNIQYKEIYVGHTPTIFFQNPKPMNIKNKLWLIDTGSVYRGKLTIMNIDTKEFWQA